MQIKDCETAAMVAQQMGAPAFDFRDKKVVILGLARQGIALARFFVAAGAYTVVSDAAPAEKLTDELAALEDLSVHFVLGEHPASLLEGCDLLCLSGGVPPQLPIVQQAIAQGIPLSNDSLLTMQLVKAGNLGPVITITGSSGKTTTTTLVGQMLAASGQTVHVGGNIGTPLIDRLHKVAPGDAIVLELSSFQLELFDPTLALGTLEDLGPDIAAILNVTPNHLDRHANMAAYATAKFNLLRHLRLDGQVVLNADDPVTSRIGNDLWGTTVDTLPQQWQLNNVIASIQRPLEASQNRLIPFSRQRSLPYGAWLDGENLVYNGDVICQRAEVKLRGDHNISNLLAAAAISGAAGATVEAMRTVAVTFAGVPHRLEVVTNSDGVTWINDSIATSPERAVAALRCFQPHAQTLILLAGGKDKNLPWDTFADEVITRVDYLIGFGNAGAMIMEKVQERAQFTRQRAPNSALVQRLDEAVALAGRVAGISSVAYAGGRAGTSEAPDALPTVVLLSPGGTSYDAYRDFEARGEHFRTLVARWTTERTLTE
ncbi:MAG: UDP-N-acetylmuramoyl-L-alanine--D-glutamate ligase [Caldilineaceae bacterium]|nr:UDP-N-acetylmuramoyl-L-alanine--D-glutamate ligase [Caldilineaceae bacterium]